jgi:Na+/melibiose symporter-like transporter
MIGGTLAALILPVIFAASDTLSFSSDVLLILVPAALLAAWSIRCDSLDDGKTHHTSGLLTMWRETSLPARQVLAIHLLNALAGGTAATLFLIYTREALGLTEQAAGLLLLLYFVSGLLALPLWVAAARRIGEARVWRSAMLLAAIGFLPAAFLGEGQVVAFALVCLATGATLGADIALPAALQARVVVAESRKLNKPRGGALFGLWGMASKLALALAAGVALPLLAWLSSPEAGRGQGQVVPWLYAGLPVLIKLMAIAALQRSALMAVEPEQTGHPTEERNALDPTIDTGTTAGATRRV